MIHPQVIQGTEAEISAYLKRLRGRKNLLLIIPDEEADLHGEASVPILQNHFYFTATPEQFQEAFEALGRGHEKEPILPPEAFDRENL